MEVVMEVVTQAHLETLLSKRTAALRELEQLSHFEGLDDSRIRAVVLSSGQSGAGAVHAWIQRLHGVRRFLVARAAVEDALASIRQREHDIESDLARLSAQSQLLPGSGASEQLADHVRRLEEERPRLRACLARAAADNFNFDPILERAQRTQRSLAAVLVQLVAEFAVSTIRGAAERYGLHGLEVTRSFDEYETFQQSIEAAVGEPVLAPTIVYDARASWQRITEREEPRLEWRAPERPVPDSASTRSRSRRSIR